MAKIIKETLYTNDIDNSLISNDDVVDDNTMAVALETELDKPESERYFIKFKYKKNKARPGDVNKVFKGIPLRRVNDNNFIFRIGKKEMKIVDLDDIIMETIKHKYTKKVNEGIDPDNDTNNIYGSIINLEEQREIIYNAIMSIQETLNSLPSYKELEYIKSKANKYYIPTLLAAIGDDEYSALRKINLLTTIEELKNLYDTEDVQYMNESDYTSDFMDDEKDKEEFGEYYIDTHDISKRNVYTCKEKLEEIIRNMRNPNITQDEYEFLVNAKKYVESSYRYILDMRYEKSH